MGAGKKLNRIFLFIIVLVIWMPAETVLSAGLKLVGPPPQTSGQNPDPPNAAAIAQNVPTSLETEKVEAPPAAPAPPATLSETGSMRAEDVKALLKNVRVSEYRVNDLLTDVHPERWKLSGVTLDSFNQTLTALRAQMVALEDWRAQFNLRTDSIYLGFETYAAIDAVLPRLNGVAQSVGEHESPGYAAQFSRAGDQLFDLQQTIGSYVGSLMHNQDQLLMAFENNVAACQQTLSLAMRGHTQRARLMKNTRGGRVRRHRSRDTSSNASPSRRKADEKSQPKQTASPAQGEPGKP